MGLLDPRDHIHVRMDDDSQEYVLVTPENLEDLNQAFDIVEALCKEADIEPKYGKPAKVFEHLSKHDFFNDGSSELQDLMQDWPAHIEFVLHPDASITVPEDFEGKPVSLTISEELQSAIKDTEVELSPREKDRDEA